MTSQGRLPSVDLSQKLADKKTYQEALTNLQQKMRHLERVCYHRQARMVILFEGWDASGKGGAIRRLAEPMDPRGYRVYPITKPNDEEYNQHYLQRFWCKLPAKGGIAIFDRSWYGRVLVERIEGFASTAEWQRAYDEINRFEQMLTDDGILLIKIFLHISPEEQLKRFAERLDNPEKNWKITPDDLNNRSKWSSYLDAYEDMFASTDSSRAPWHILSGERKWHARIQVLDIVTASLESHIGTEIPRLSQAEIDSARQSLGIG